MRMEWSGMGNKKGKGKGNRNRNIDRKGMVTGNEVEKAADRNNDMNT